MTDRPSPTTTRRSAEPPLVVALDDARALDAGLTGAKAANLARAAVHHLPVLPGFALTTAATADGSIGAEAKAALRAAWTDVGGDRRTLVVRSSSTAEDTSTSSMAGQFTSVLGVRGWDSFLAAVATVLDSASHPHDGLTAPQPMAVLVQPQLETGCGGVLFGLDPVTGDRHHLVVEAVPGTPDVLVSGTATASHVVLSRRGRRVGGHDRRLLPLSRRRRLARLAAGAAVAFGGPQDVEWAFDEGDRLWLLQSRAVTATGDLAVDGPILGPGPVAETLPAPLRPLEIDLWVSPLRDGVAGALHVIGAVSRRRIERSPVVTTVGGWVAADLDLFGIVPRRRGLRRALDPVPGARRLLSAWRVGRLRAALPALAADVIDAVDADLESVGALDALDDAALLDLLGWATRELVALHGHEVLAGMVVHGDGDRSSAALVALAELRRARADGLDDDDAVARAPVVLALTPPAVCGVLVLPAVPPIGAAPVELGWREALRLRCRWVQELGARIAAELAARLVAEGTLAAATLVRELTLPELQIAVSARAVPSNLSTRATVPPGPPLPIAFRVGPAMAPIPLAPRRHDHADGLAASTGRASGVVTHDPTTLPDGEPCILVVETLDPRLAAVLPRVAGLVSETGSALSHLAILAREMHVPAVVAVPDARTRFPVGSRVLLDGRTGEVSLVTTTSGAVA